MPRERSSVGDEYGRMNGRDERHTGTVAETREDDHREKSEGLKEQQAGQAEHISRPTGNCQIGEQP